MIFINITLLYISLFVNTVIWYLSVLS